MMHPLMRLSLETSICHSSSSLASMRRWIAPWVFQLALLAACLPALPAQEAPMPAEQAQGLLHATDPHDSLRIYQELADQLYQRDYWSALSYAQQAVALAERLNSLPGEVKSLNLLGLALRQMGNYELALQAFDQGLSKNADLGDAVLQLQLLRNKGNTLQAMGEWEEAIAVYYDGMHKAEQDSLSNYLNGFYTALAQVKFAQGDTLAAKAFYEQSISRLDPGASPRRRGAILYNYAIFLARMEQYPEALARLQEVLPYFEDPDLIRNRAITLGAIGDLYKDMGDWEKARTYMHRSLREKQRAGIPENIIYAYLSLGELMDTLGLLDSARLYLQNGLDMAEDLEEDLPVMSELHQALADVQEQLGNTRQALHHLRLHMALETERWEETERATTTEIEKKYNFGRQTGENMALRAENELNAVRLSRQRLILFTTLGLLASSMIIGLLLLRQARHKRRAAQTIARQQARLHQERVQRLQQEAEVKAINAMMDGQEQERHRIAEALHSSLGSLLSAIKMHFHSLTDHWVPSQAPLAEKTGRLIEEACRSNRQIAHELLPPVLMRLGLEAAIRQLAEKTQGPDLLVETHVFGLDRRLPEKMALTIYRAVDELLNNIMKHARATRVAIQLTEHDDSLNILVEDNGRGFEYNPEQGNYGLGLTNLRSRVRHLGGSLHIDSRPGQGTTVIIDLPLPQATDPERTDTAHEPIQPAND